MESLRWDSMLINDNSNICKDKKNKPQNMLKYPCKTYTNLRKENEKFICDSHHLHQANERN
ncbi:MAG: hypothetical protein HDT10_05170 [Helicobacter sp.]|nr:hypothetical protein [Helicobacter sp.]